MDSIRARLNEELQEVETELARIEEKLKVRGDYGFGRGDPAIYQWELNLSLKERYEKHLEDVQAALRRLEEGSYGVCERCQKAIEKERLEALPFTSLCIECAKQAA
jgi:RNA polymerase-binding protein DksA